MKKALLITGLAALVFARCSSTSPAFNPWHYSRDAIHVSITADEKLNSYDGDAHSVQVGLYQLSENAAFLELSKNHDGCNTLLKIDKFDASAISCDRIIVYPNDNKLLKFDRMENAKWIGIIAGYYMNAQGIPPNLVTEIPMKQKRKTLLRRLIELTGLIQQKDMRYVPPLHVQLMMTPVTIHETSEFK